ncbi:MAG: hypothetical protein Q8903_08145 [Bacteroidota bacterium]|nr:hypothetical protein [Bacteroidota bacterium]
MQKYYHKGVIKSGYLCRSLTGVRVKALDVNGNILAESISGKQGEYKVEAETPINTISFELAGYILKRITNTNSDDNFIRLLENKIIGYQPKLWFNPGEDIDVYINSPVNYKATLIRHGIKTSSILNLGTFTSQLQTLPDSKFVKEGLGWEKSFSYKLPTFIEPGIYSLDIQSVESKESYRLSFLVSTPPSEYGKKTRLLVLASTNNWQTYNVWGGRSRYRNFEDEARLSLKDRIYIMGVKTIPEGLRAKIKEMLGNNIVVTEKDHPNAWQFKELGVNRPHPNCSVIDDDPYTPFTSHLTAGEWRVLAWLEREKFSYDIVSGNELHNNPDLLLNYNAIILNTHCEYWSREMFAGLETFNNNGGSILNLSGNSIYREITFKQGGNNIRCVSLRYEKSAGDETQVIGVRFDMRGYGNCSPYTILNSKHWTFKGLNIPENNEFGKQSLNNPSGGAEGDDFNPVKPGMLTQLNGNGGSGWETDKISPSAPKDIKLIAKGTNKNNGGADMIIREFGKTRGMLFSASSITFGGTLLVDEVSSGIVNNVLRHIKNYNNSKTNKTEEKDTISSLSPLSQNL